jgi:hypothetical protein
MRCAWSSRSPAGVVSFLRQVDVDRDLLVDSFLLES